MNGIGLFFLFVSFAIIVLYELSVKSVSIVLWGGLFIFFAVPHGIDVIFISKNFSESTYLTATLFALSFNVVYLSTRFLLHNIKIHSPRWLSASSSYLVERNYFLILLWCLTTSTVLFMVHIYTTFGSFTNFTWIDLFDNRQTIFYIASSYLLTLSAPMAYIAVIRRKYSLAVFALILVLIVLVLSRVRANAIVMFLPLIVWYLYSVSSYKKIIGRLFGSLIFGAAFIWIVLLVGALRVFGDFSEPIDFFDILQVTLDLVVSPHSEFGLRNAFYFFIENDNNFDGFGMGLGYIRLLLMPIPSSLAFDLKPIDFASYMSVAYDPENSTLGINSMHPTLYGDLFANFYYLGIFLGVFWAALIKLLDSLCLRQLDNIFAASVFVSIIYALTLVARGSLYNGLFNIFFLLVVNWLLWFILDRAPKIKLR